MFCPKCTYEYREGFTIRPDCGTPLVDKLPDESDEYSSDSVEDGPSLEFTELETVYITGRCTDLLLAKSLLESSGVTCFVDRNFSYQPTNRPSALRVRPEDVEAAKPIHARMNLSRDDDPLRSAEFESEAFSR